MSQENGRPHPLPLGVREAEGTAPWQQPCATCRGLGTVPRDGQYDEFHYLPCPVCQRGKGYCLGCARPLPTGVDYCIVCEPAGASSAELAAEIHKAIVQVKDVIAGTLEDQLAFANQVAGTGSYALAYGRLEASVQATIRALRGA